MAIEQGGQPPDHEEENMWWFIKEVVAGLALCWRQWWNSKATWRCTPEELSPRARALMLGAVAGVSGPLVNVKAAQAKAETGDEEGSSDRPAE
jgi:hypothetical protein